MTKKRKKKKQRIGTHTRNESMRRAECALDQDFVSKRAALEAFLVQFNAGDAFLSLLVSELWLPNLSAQIKHCFAAETFASITPGKFRSDQRIESYGAFRSFILKSYQYLPSIPMLEDYAPESDWGDIKALTRAGILKIFYGGEVERITDFISAFRMKHADNSAAIRDLDTALELQHHLLSSIERPEVSADASLELGSLHLPSEKFWEQCRSALLKLPRGMDGNAFSPELILHQGILNPKRSLQEFGNAVLSGSTLPCVLLDLEGSIFPVSPRNSASNVIHFWEQQPSGSQERVEQQVAESLALFLKHRIRRSIAGPYRIAIRNGRGDRLEVPAFLSLGSTLWAVVALSPSRLSKLNEIERRLFEMFESDGAVIALDLSTRELVAFRTDEREDAYVDSIKLIVVITDASPDPKPIRALRSNARKLFLSEFISIVESIDSAEELISYFDFVDNHPQATLSSVVGAVDLFAAFKQSHSMLVEGAIEPDFIALDPHWGSTWRYERQRKFWLAAPAVFPDDIPTAWAIEPSRGTDRLIRLTGRAARKLVWTADLSFSSLHFMLDVDAQELEVEDGSLLETFIHCIADSAVQRSGLLPSRVFCWRRIVTLCVAREDRLPSKVEEDLVVGAPLLPQWTIIEDTPTSLVVRAEVDLNVARLGLTDAKTAKFEAEGLATWLDGLSQLVGLAIPEDAFRKILDSGNRRPRFTMSTIQRPIDVPDHSEPLLPSPAHYKAARRELAIVFKNLGAEPGRYELADAKAIIDPARDTYRESVHQEISAFATSPLVQNAIEQFDANIADYDRTAYRIKMSLNHEVDYDRRQDLAKAHEEFVRNARNYRYLLECALSSRSVGDKTPTSDDIVKLIAKIDWLIVLYGASDALHNEIDVGGIVLDNFFVPEVFYSSERDEAYGLELAETRLGLGVTDDQTAPITESETKQLNEAMFLDAGFTLVDLINALTVLSRWPSVNDRPDDVQLSYRASTPDLVAAMVDVASDMKAPAAQRALSFLTLDPSRIRILSGRSAEESDVPIWEHRKRDHRYAIRPLIHLDEQHLMWGAAAAARARDIWTGTLSDGYPPADLPWPHVNAVASSIKRRIELELEVRAFEVCQRHASQVLRGVNFKDRFPKQAYEDVGDFDVLAYWPESNHWLTIECKYNKPPFCAKDARRLREEIFGKAPGGGQISKIVRRREFLLAHAERLRQLLKWSVPNHAPITILDLYVCPRIFYWMRSPPYPLQTEFVRLDKLDSWLQSMLGAYTRDE